MRPIVHGIYLIRNVKTGCFYIGSSIDVNTRWRIHKNDLNANKHHSIYLQRSWNKHGANSFIFGIIEEISDVRHLIEREQYFIDLMNPKYNIAKKAGSQLGRKLTEEQKQKLRDRVISDETRKKMSDAAKANGAGYKLGKSRIGKPSWAKGTKASPEKIQKMRLANLGKKYSKETNLKKGLKLEKHPKYGSGKRIIQMDLLENKIAEFRCSTDVMNKLGFHNANILKCCKGKIKTSYGFKWKFK